MRFWSTGIALALFGCSSKPTSMLSAGMGHTANTGGGAGGYGYGQVGNAVAGGGGPSGRRNDDVVNTEKDTIVMGSIDKELIKQAIHRNRKQLQYCYQMQLNRFPALAGKIAVSFVIAEDGSVKSSSIASSTADNAGFEACIAQSFKRFKFLPPKGGGIVKVTYPLVFNLPEADGGPSADGG